MRKANTKYVITRKGRDIMHKILIVECDGITTYSIKVNEYNGNDIYRSITEDEYHRTIRQAVAKGYFVYEKKAK
jgi:hypothetical protein